MPTSFFKQTQILLAGGPSPEMQTLAIKNDNYWIILNTHLLIPKHYKKKSVKTPSVFDNLLAVHNKGRDLYFLSLSDVSAENLKDCYCYCYCSKTQKLIYVTTKDTYQQVDIKNHHVFDNQLEKIRALKPDENMIHLSDKEIHKLITLNGGHTPPKPNKKTNKLTIQVNAYKHTLQTLGPCPENISLEIINNTGKAHNHIFHGHPKDENGTYHVLEWAEIDASMYYEPIFGCSPEKLENRKIYIDVTDNVFRYAVISPSGEIIKASIPNNVLTEYKIPSDKMLTKDTIKKHWSKLLDITSKKGHTCINRMIALLNFAPHENYPYRQAPLDKDEIKKILNNENNQTIIENASLSVQMQKKAHRPPHMAIRS